MGNFIFTVIKPASNNIPASLKPSNYEWLSVHSLETGLSLVEVERLWVRFQQLGCDNNGLWNIQVVSNSVNKLGRNAFQQKIIQQLRPPDRQYVTFYDFINGAIWLEHSTTEDKLKSAFAIVNDNRPITVDSLRQTLVIILPGKAQEEIDQFVEDIFHRIGVVNPDTNIAEIIEEDFVHFLKVHIPPKKLDELFRFRICPSLNPPIVRETPKIDSKKLDQFPDNSNIPTDLQLEEISASIGERDCSQLAGLLGILEYDVNHLVNVYRGNRPKIAFGILREWKQKSGARASFSALKKALYSAGFIDIFNKVEFG